MMRLTLAAAVLGLAACRTLPAPPPTPTPEPTPDPAATDLRDPRETHLGPLVQLTSGGENAEAYWSFAGDRLIFQTTREGVPCDQIMSMPAGEMAAPEMLSTGLGRTTCSYYLPGDREVVYASTHHVDPACPPPPDRSKGYVWALYDFDIFKHTVGGDPKQPVKLFGTPGQYDAEATVCAVDGTIVFTSDKDGDLELYSMKPDGSDVKRLTSTPGYDGGAFFSPDCKQLVWRASRPSGADLDDYRKLLAEHLVRPTRLEIWIANADGSEARQITNLGKASFAPYFHPSGKRVLFSTNFGDERGREFDLWAVDTDGTDLERITYSAGFDGFPMFSPDGKRLAFSSNRGAPPPPPGRHSGDTNVFVADWIEHAPRETVPTGADHARRAVDWLADDAREGRGVGTAGLTAAAAWMADELAAIGVEGGLSGKQFLQRFEVVTAIRMEPGTTLAIDGKPVTGFVPARQSANGTVEGITVFAGNGIVGTRENGKALDAYKGKNVRGKVVVIEHVVPDDLGMAERFTLGDAYRKAVSARERGATAVILVDASPQPLARFDGADAGIPIVYVDKATGAALMKGTHKVKLSVELTRVKTPTDNVVGVIRGGPAALDAAPIVVGAHLDHLGFGGAGSGALDASSEVHNGADDNASGIAALLEVARTLAPQAGKLNRDVYLIGFSAEEMGIIGSRWFVAHAPYSLPPAAMINMDMVGRLADEPLQVFGAESAAEWGGLITAACSKRGIVCQMSGQGYGPSDHTSFYEAGAPVLHLFTGSHLDYHRVSDDAASVNPAGIAAIGALVADLVLAVDAAPALTYVKSAAPPKVGDVPLRGGSLGTIPTYGEDGSVPGVLLADVVPGGAAATAGLRKGDRIVKIGVTDVRNVNDLMLVLGEAVPGQATTIVYLRDGVRAEAKATFGTPRMRR